MSQLFSSSRHSGYRLLVALLLSLVLLQIDQRTTWLAPLRLGLSYLTGPLHLVAHVPVDMVDWLGENMQSHGGLLEDNRILRQQNLILQQKNQQLAVLRAENLRLRELLNSSARLPSSVSVAEIIGISPDPDRQELVINRGTHDGAFLGQVVLDAYGVMGQISRVGVLTSHVLLITDANHAMSVQDNRTGMHSILMGSGHPGQLQLLYVPVATDVAVGDLLVSTGLEGRFPRGYPVAVITHVGRDSSASSFLSITARPEAHIQRASHVLLMKQHALPPLPTPEAPVPTTPASSPVAAAADPVVLSVATPQVASATKPVLVVKAPMAPATSAGVTRHE